MTAHKVVDALAVNPDVGNNATIRLTDRLICNSFSFNEVRQDASSLLPAVFPKLRAINSCKPYPFTATSDERIAVIDFGAFCMIFHYTSPFIIFTVSIACALCYNAIVTYKPPPLGMGETGVGPVWAESPAPPLPKWLCLPLHHSPIVLFLPPLQYTISKWLSTAITTTPFKINNKS